MQTWWLAIDLEFTSYEQLKRREVVAQGWPKLGDLRDLCPLVGKGDKENFKSQVAALERHRYERVPTHANKVMWQLMSIRAGDLVVGIEGISVKGICEVQRNGWSSYRYFPESQHNYAQTIGFPIKWVDWTVGAFGFVPTAPAQSVQGVKGLRNESKRVIEAWESYTDRVNTTGIVEKDW